LLGVLSDPVAAEDESAPPRLEDVARPGSTVEVEGRFEHGIFRAESIQASRPRRRVSLKGRLDSFSRGGTASLGGFDFDVPADASVGEGVDAGTWVRARFKWKSGRLWLHDIRRRPVEHHEELRGRIETAELKRRQFTIAGIIVVLEPDLEVERPPRVAPGRPYSPIARDEERRRPEDPLRKGRFTFGGEIQYDAELRDNFDLDDEEQEDRLVHELSMLLEVEYNFGPRGFAFLSVGFGMPYVGFDQDRDLELESRFRVGQAFVLWKAAPKFRLQAGRQSFRDRRTWVMNVNLDALRARWELGPLELQAAIATQLFDDDAKGIWNAVLGVEWEIARNNEILFYALHRQGGEEVELDRTHFGINGEAEWGGATLWLDAAYVTGTENDLPVEGYGFDVLALYEFEDWPWEPTVYIGFAYGSGDPDIEEEREAGFRQTGFQDNYMRVTGSASFRYLGALVRPELSNILVFTAGVGVRPARDTSLEIVYHVYEQDVAAPFLRDSRLRADPNGSSRELGSEIDLVLGIETWFPLELKLVVGYFAPGAAFEPGDDAFFAVFEVEWNF
jgi:alginate production protein